MKLVDRVVLHGGPIPFSQLAERVITPRTRFLILDLDRTVHLGWNMGELLGWELLVLRAYGAREQARMEARRARGRLIFDPSRPLRSLRYLGLGAWVWGLPGLYYLFFGKIPARFAPLSRLSHRVFGPEPMRRVQRVPQVTLLKSLVRMPAGVLRELAQRVWARHAPDQVIEESDLSALRARCPGLKVVVSSASPQVMVEVARERLGADIAQGSDTRRINSGPDKVARLAETLPEALAPSSETVGITDTGYREDHCWAEHFSTVVDINSRFPFSPLVPAGSPLREVHSARVMTRTERARHAAGAAGWMDPRREARARDVARTFERAELEALLGDLLERARVLADDEGPGWSLAVVEREARRRLDDPPGASTARAGAAAFHPA